MWVKFLIKKYSISRKLRNQSSDQHINVGIQNIPDGFLTKSLILSPPMFA